MHYKLSAYAGFLSKSLYGLVVSYDASPRPGALMILQAGGWGDIIRTEQTLRKSVKRIEFHNREKETKEIMAILDSEPSLITFVYGPINSGKTTLITHLIEELPDEYVIFYVNLRGKFISNYDDFFVLCSSWIERRKSIKRY